MKEMKENNSFDEDVRVKQLLNQAEETKELELKPAFD
jgi:hypothetical protein